MIAILHNIRSLHNVGSIFRTADGAGVLKIYLTGYTPSPVDKLGKKRSQLTKVSLGAEESVEWEKIKDINVVIKKLKKDGYKIYAVEQAKNSIPYYSVRISSGNSDAIRDIRIALLMGNEVRGLSPAILKKCDKIIEIPMRGKKESLNVSVAFGVVVYELKVAL